MALSSDSVDATVAVARSVVADGRIGVGASVVGHYGLGSHSVVSAEEMERSDTLKARSRRSKAVSSGGKSHERGVVRSDEAYDAPWQLPADCSPHGDRSSVHSA